MRPSALLLGYTPPRRPAPTDDEPSTLPPLPPRHCSGVSSEVLERLASLGDDLTPSLIALVCRKDHAALAFDALRSLHATLSRRGLGLTSVIRGRTLIGHLGRIGPHTVKFGLELIRLAPIDERGGLYRAMGVPLAGRGEAKMS